MIPRIKNHRYPIRSMTWLVILSLSLAACSSATAQPTSPEATEPPVSAPTKLPVSEPTIAPPIAPPVAGQAPSGLSADPRRVEFQAEDGKNLVGYYYPSKNTNAPVIILMHWAGGDLCDWSEIVPWLQNRQSDNPAKLERCANVTEEKKPTWLDPTWFPPMSPQISMAVFVFDFRSYGESEAGGSWTDYAKDAKAAFITAAGLEGVDPTRMAAMGASIGADGAADGCLLYNQKAGGGCLGALSLSPGNYLGMPYAGVVTDLAPTPVWCFAAEGDGESAPTCKGASSDQYRSQIYAGSAHGMMLITPDLEPQPMLLIREFLMLLFAETMR